MLLASKAPCILYHSITYVQYNRLQLCGALFSSLSASHHRYIPDMHGYRLSVCVILSLQNTRCFLDELWSVMDWPSFWSTFIGRSVSKWRIRHGSDALVILFVLVIRQLERSSAKFCMMVENVLVTASVIIVIFSAWGNILPHLPCIMDEKFELDRTVLFTGTATLI